VLTNARPQVPAEVPASVRLREMLAGPQLAFLMEAHDGLSARIADVEGFEAIWASGFAVSTALGVRDTDEASWSQLLTVVQWMTEAVTLPIVIDGDTGYGNFNTTRRFAHKAERLGAAAVCFEDKVFPKMNSFVGDDHELADVDEFCVKLRACKEYQDDPNFCVVARTEALIAGHSMDEALERAHAYAAAGADAIFIHSREPDATEIEEFAGRWDGELPLVISPTTYGAVTPTDFFRRCGIGAVIWANHNMRAAVAAMRRVCRSLRQTETLRDAEAEIAPLAEVFGLMNYDELAAAEQRLYAPTGTGWSTQRT
jgi:phosphoenolpyruvate phosphomutase